ncbi:unnamed protein product [Prunus armeniaca]
MASSPDHEAYLAGFETLIANMFPIDLTFDVTDVELNDIKMLVIDFKLQVQYAVSQNETKTIDFFGAINGLKDFKEIYYWDGITYKNTARDELEYIRNVSMHIDRLQGICDAAVGLSMRKKVILQPHQSISEQHIMLTDFEGATRKNEVGFCIWTSKEFHQYQVVGRKLPTASDEHPKIY